LWNCGLKWSTSIKGFPFYGSFTSLMHVFPDERDIKDSKTI
jgi:hypothetical protein